jgi:glycosyltransferase involved in cell wall biosynthesis
MNIFWPDIHKNLTKGIAEAFHLLNHTLILPSKDYKIKHRAPEQFTQFVWNEEWTQEKAEEFFKHKNIKVLNKEEILDLKPDIIFITSFETQFEILNELWPHLKDKSKLAFYSGNDYWDGAYPFYISQNYLCADYTGYLLSNKYQLNYLYYKPWVDYDRCKFEGPTDTNIVGVYISEYEKNFNKEYLYSKELKKLTPYIEYHYHTNSTKEELTKTLHSSIATQHIKSLEGYGIAIIESMACGKPVFLHRALTQNKSLMQWSIENVTALFFETNGEYIAKLKALMESKDYRHFLQNTTSKVIRQIINNENETKKLSIFLNSLI